MINNEDMKNAIKRNEPGPVEMPPREPTGDELIVAALRERSKGKLEAKVGDWYLTRLYVPSGSQCRDTWCLVKRIPDDVRIPRCCVLMPTLGMIVKRGCAHALLDKTIAVRVPDAQQEICEQAWFAWREKTQTHFADVISTVRASFMEANKNTL